MNRSSGPHRYRNLVNEETLKQEPEPVDWIVGQAASLAKRVFEKLDEKSLLKDVFVIELVTIELVRPFQKVHL